MTVKELIEFLQTQPQDTLVAYSKYSEQCVLELADIEVIQACQPRNDGWIQSYRPDKLIQTYVLFPGN